MPPCYSRKVQSHGNNKMCVCGAGGEQQNQTPKPSVCQASPTWPQRSRKLQADRGGLKLQVSDSGTEGPYEIPSKSDTGVKVPMILH